MRKFRFLHCADLHIDSPFKGLALLDKELAAACREATFRACERIVDIALEQQVDFVTVGGDIYDGAERSLRAAVFFRDQMTRMAQRGIPVCIVAGNHDPLDSLIAPVRFPENVHLFGDQPEFVPVVRKDFEIARVHGISFPTARVEENLALRLKPGSNAPFAIGLLHCNVAGQSGHENYAPCALDDLIHSGMDAWCLGHVHAYGLLSPSRPLVVYPGNPQGRHINEAGQRGCTLVGVDELGNISTQFIPVHQARWERVEVDISEFEDVDGLLAGVEDRLCSASAGGPEDLLVARIRWHGRGPLHDWLSLQKPEDLRTMLQERLTMSTSRLCIESLENATGASIDRYSLLLQESFVGDFLRLIEEARQGGPALNAVLDSLSELFENRLCRRFLTDGPVVAAMMGDQSAIRALLDDAETLALDYLMPET
ncbi:MAG: DNA repair exonuclease [Deltaproteobacteria bacterium]|nr:DNA repair exonuclease [Deltaproteobacteria bacterium]